MKKIYITSILFSIFFSVGSYFMFFGHASDIRRPKTKSNWVKVYLHGAFINEGMYYFHSGTTIRDIVYKNKAEFADLKKIRRTWNHKIYDQEQIELIYIKTKWKRKSISEVLNDKWLLKKFHITKKVIVTLKNLLQQKNQITWMIIKKQKGIGSKTLASLQKIMRLK